MYFLPASFRILQCRLGGDADEQTMENIGERRARQ